MTAASLFDGHDAAINVMRRLLQAQGAEVIHLGHDRSVDEIVGAAAIQEDVHAVAVSSYQGGHMEFFAYLVQQLRERGGEAHARLRRRRRHHLAGGDRRAAGASAWRASSAPTTAARSASTA